MRAAGKLASNLLDELSQQVLPGVSTYDLDMFAKNFIEQRGVKSACYGYKGGGSVPFPGYICTSVNHVICHGVPSKDQILQEGDIVGIDVTLIVDGYYGDTCRTFPVGLISKEASALINATEEAMYAGIAAVQPGNYTGDIGHAIEALLSEKYHNRYSIVRDYCGHGIGNVFHAPPQIEHTGDAGQGHLLQEGMFFTIEPMINAGGYETRTLKDKWTVISKDYKLSAQFEHTIGVTENGCEVFTKS